MGEPATPGQPQAPGWSFASLLGFSGAAPAIHAQPDSTPVEVISEGRPEAGLRVPQAARASGGKVLREDGEARPRLKKKRSKRERGEAGSQKRDMLLNHDSQEGPTRLRDRYARRELLIDAPEIPSAMGVSIGPGGGADLLDGWAEYADPVTGRPYFAHATTGTVTWQRPRRSLAAMGALKSLGMAAAADRTTVREVVSSEHLHLESGEEGEDVGEEGHYSDTTAQPDGLPAFPSKHGKKGSLPRAPSASSSRQPPLLRLSSANNMVAKIGMDKFLRSQSYSRKQIEAAAAWVPLEVDKDAAAVPKPVRVASAKRGMDAFMAQLEARDSMRRPVTAPNEAAQEASHEAEEEGEEAEQSRVQHQGVEQEPKPGWGQVHAEGGGLQRDPIQLDQLDQAEVERMQTRDTGEVVEQEGGGKAARSMKELAAERVLLQRALQRADKLLNGSEIRAEMADSLSAEELTRAVEQQEGQQRREQGKWVDALKSDAQTVSAGSALGRKRLACLAIQHMGGIDPENAGMDHQREQALMSAGSDSGGVVVAALAAVVAGIAALEAGAATIGEVSAAGQEVALRALMAGDIERQEGRVSSETASEVDALQADCRAVGAAADALGGQAQDAEHAEFAWSCQHLAQEAANYVSHCATQRTLPVGAATLQRKLRALARKHRRHLGKHADALARNMVEQLQRMEDASHTGNAMSAIMARERLEEECGALETALPALEQAGRLEATLWAPFAVVDRAAATSRATREYSRLAADTTTRAAALAGSSMESGDVGLPLVAEQLRRRLATLQSTAQEEEFAALEGGLSTGFAHLRSLQQASTARVELLRAASAPDSAVPRRQVAAQRNEHQAKALAALRGLSALREAAGVAAEELASGQNGMASTDVDEYASLIIEIQASISANSALAIASSVPDSTALGLEAATATRLEVWQQDLRARGALWRLRRSVLSGAEAAAGLAQLKQSSSTADSQIDRARKEALREEVWASTGRAEAIGSELQMLLGAGAGAGLQYDTLASEYIALAGGLCRAVEEDGTLAAGALQQLLRAEEEWQGVTVTAVEASLSAVKAALEQTLPGDANSDEMVAGRLHLANKAFQARRLLSASAAVQAQGAPEGMPIAGFRQWISEVESAADATTEGQGKPEVVAEVSRKLAGIQGEWLHSRMHGMMEAAAAAMESFGGMKPPSVVEGNGAEAQAMLAQQDAAFRAELERAQRELQTQLAAAVALSRELGRVDPEAAAEHQAAVEAMFAEVDFVAGRMAAEARRPGSSAVAPRGAGARQMRRVRAIEVRAGAEEVEANLSKLLGGLEAAEHGKGGAEELQEEVQAARAQAQALQAQGAKCAGEWLVLLDATERDLNALSRGEQHRHGTAALRRRLAALRASRKQGDTDAHLMSVISQVEKLEEQASQLERSRKMQEGEELAAMMEDALARFEAAEADKDKNNHLGSQDRVAQLAASEAAARRELEEMAAQLLRETDMAMAMADSLGTEIPENFAAQRLQFVEDIQAEVQAILNGKPTSSMEQESDNGQHAVVVHGTSAAKSRGSSRLAGKLEQLREREATRQMADLMQRAVQTVTELEGSHTSAPKDCTAAELAHLEQRHAAELEMELRGLHAEISAAAAILQTDIADIPLSGTDRDTALQELAALGTDAERLMGVSRGAGSAGTPARGSQLIRRHVELLQQTASHVDTALSAAVAAAAMDRIGKASAEAEEGELRAELARQEAAMAEEIEAAVRALQADMARMARTVAGDAEGAGLSFLAEVEALNGHLEGLVSRQGRGRGRGARGGGELGAALANKEAKRMELAMAAAVASVEAAEARSQAVQGASPDKALAAQEAAYKAEVASAMTSLTGPLAEALAAAEAAKAAGLGDPAHLAELRALAASLPRSERTAPKARPRGAGGLADALANQQTKRMEEAMAAAVASVEAADARDWTMGGAPPDEALAAQESEHQAEVVRAMADLTGPLAEALAAAEAAEAAGLGDPAYLADLRALAASMPVSARTPPKARPRGAGKLAGALAKASEMRETKLVEFREREAAYRAEVAAMKDAVRAEMAEVARALVDTPGLEAAGFLDEMAAMAAELEYEADGLGGGRRGVRTRTGVGRRDAAVGVLKEAAMARMKADAMAVVEAVEVARAKEEAAVSGLVGEEREKFKRALRAGLWEQDKRLRAELDNRKRAMLAEVEDLMRAARPDASVSDAVEAAGFRADVAQLTELLGEEAPAFPGAPGVLAYSAKAAAAGKQRTGGARGGQTRDKHMKALTSNEEKLKVIDAAMKRAKEIAKAEAAQFSVWQKMQEREALRAEMLKKAREKKKRIEEEVAASVAEEEAAAVATAAEDAALAAAAEEALLKKEEWHRNKTALDEEARKAAARERLAKVEEKLRRAEERMAAKALPRPRRGFKRSHSAKAVTAEPAVDAHGSEASPGPLSVADPAAAALAPGEAQEGRPLSSPTPMAEAEAVTSAELEGGGGQATEGALYTDDRSEPVGEVAGEAVSEEDNALDKLAEAAAGRAGFMRRYGQQTLTSDKLKGAVTTNPRLSRAMKRLDKLKALPGGGEPQAPTEADAEAKATDTVAAESAASTSFETNVGPDGSTPLPLGSGQDGTPLPPGSPSRPSRRAGGSGRSALEGPTLPPQPPARPAILNGPPLPPPPAAHLAPDGTPLPPPPAARLAPDGTPLPPPEGVRPRKPKRRKGSSLASSRPMTARSRAAPEDPMLEEQAALALIEQGLPDITYEIIDEEEQPETMDDTARRERALEAAVQNIPPEVRQAADAAAGAAWEVAALARYRFDIDDVEVTQRRPPKKKAGKSMEEAERQLAPIGEEDGEGEEAATAEAEPSGASQEEDAARLPSAQPAEAGPPAAKSGSLLGPLPGMPGQQGGGDALDGQQVDVDWRAVLPGEMGELAQRAQKRAAARQKRALKKQQAREMAALNPPSDEEETRQGEKGKLKQPAVSETKSHARSKAQGIFAELGLGVPERPSKQRSRIKAADLAAEKALASVEAMGDAAFAPGGGTHTGGDNVVADAIQAAQSAQEAIRNEVTKPGDWAAAAEIGDKWKKPLLFDAAADGGLKPEEIEARELARRLLSGDASSNLEEKHVEATRLLELLQNSRSAFRTAGKKAKDQHGEAGRFGKGDIALYRQHDGRIRRVEVVAVEEDPEGDTKYSIEVDASVRMTTADRLSHIPQGFEGVVDEAELRAESEADGKKGLEEYVDWDWCPSLAISGTNPAPRAGHVMATNAMAAVLFGGASEHGDFHEDTWEFCGESLRWKLADCLGEAPGRRAYATISTVYPYQFSTCRMMLFGGWDGEDCTAGLHVLEGVENVTKEPLVWKAPNTTGVLPQPRCMHSACLVVGGIGAERFFHGQVLDEMGNVGAQELPVQELVVFGGWVSVGVSLFQGMALEEMDSGGEFLNDMCALDIDKLEWRRVIPRGTFLPEPRAGHSAVVTGRRMLVFGGQSQYEPLNELLEFQLDLATWRRVQLRGANPSPRSGHSCVMIDQGKRMLVFGGFDGDQAMHDLYVLDTATFIWTQLDLPGGHPLARSGAACALMGPSRIYMMGGYCKAGFIADMHALDLKKRQIHKVKLSGGPYSTSLYKLRITFAEGVEPESVPLAVQWYRANDKGRFERIKGATSMAYLPNADDMMTSLGVACLPCTADTGRALGSAFFASSKKVKIDPELSMLVKHLIANSYAEFKIRLLSEKGSSRQLMLVLTPTAIKIKLDGKTQIKDGYNHTFKIILSIHRLNTFVLQLNESTVLPMAVEHVYERDLVVLTARGFWAIAMSRPQPAQKPVMPAADQLAAAYAKRKRKEEKAAAKRDIWKDHPGTQAEPAAPGLQGSLAVLQRDLQTATRSKKVVPGTVQDAGGSGQPLAQPSAWVREGTAAGKGGPTVGLLTSAAAGKRKQQAQARGWVIE